MNATYLIHYQTMPILHSFFKVQESEACYVMCIPTGTVGMHPVQPPVVVGGAEFSPKESPAGNHNSAHTTITQTHTPSKLLAFVGPQSSTISNRYCYRSMCNTNGKGYRDTPRPHILCISPSPLCNAFFLVSLGLLQPRAAPSHDSR